MQETIPESISMNESYKIWRESANHSFLEKVPETLLHYMFCVGWHEREISGLYEKEFIKEINKLFK